ncbi:hypothetical protein [Nocardioides jejuensis]|nr:hypothetical protein [Nocardioides jejuensis]
MTYPTYDTDGTFKDDDPDYFCRWCLSGRFDQKIHFRRLVAIPLGPK